MKKHLAGALLAGLIFPCVAWAAPLTDGQARSLIAVVQSSPTTPASAFTNLITTFSNITTAQAESLINVVQAAPGVSPDAFVNLLISFTVDTQPAPSSGTIPTPTPVQTEQTSPAISPTIQVVDNSEVVVDIKGPVGIDPDAGSPYGEFVFYVRVKGADGKYTQGAPVQMSAVADDLYKGSNSNAKLTNNVSTPDSQDWNASFIYHPTKKGTKNITFTSGSLSKEVSVVVQ